MSTFWRLTSRCLFLLLLLCLSSCRTSPPVGITAQVQRVVSGQTIDVLIPQQSAAVERVRLIGISAPDLQQQPWGVAAKKRLEELLSEPKGTQMVLQSVVLETEGDKDRFERRLAYVWVDGDLVNEQLVAQGYVLADRDWGKYSQRLTHAQEYARIMEWGIWNPERPMRLTPEEFRRSNAST